MAPRKREQLEAIRESSRTAIMRAALQLFAERGYHATTIDAIARAAGIAKGLVYNYFSSKQELLEQVVVLGFREFEGLLPHLTSVKDPKKRLRRLIELSEELICGKTEFYRLYLMVLLQVNRDTRFKNLIHQYSQKVFDEIAAMLRELDVPQAEIEARLLSAVLDGIGLHTIVFSGAYPLREVLQALQRHYVPADGPGSKKEAEA